MSVIARAFAVADGTAADLAAFTDASAVSNWAVASVAGLVRAGIVSGDAGRLSPKATITRAEIAQMLYELGLQFCSDAGCAPGLRPRRLYRHRAPDGGRLLRHALPRRRRRT